ncbi:MAG: RNA polymerase sigma factor, partial [Chthoniobacterales bacterium]|nr:RNA polymerase sigma factor [Chthoniobacterales bacterium]
MADLDFNRLVEEHYQPLYRFAFSLSRNEPDACDLVQQAFATWAAKGHQLRDTSKAKTWLFTTLYREFLGQRRRVAHLVDPDENTEFVEPPDVSPSAARAIDAASVQRALHRLEERYRAPVTLFYMEQHSYREIAEILAVPIGTVMSRISRGKAELRKAVGELAHAETRKVIPM